MDRSAALSSFAPVRSLVDELAAELVAERAEAGSTAEAALLVGLGPAFQRRMHAAANVHALHHLPPAAQEALVSRETSHAVSRAPSVDDLPSRVVGSFRKHVLRLAEAQDDGAQLGLRGLYLGNERVRLDVWSLVLASDEDMAAVETRLAAAARRRGVRLDDHVPSSAFLLHRMANDVAAKAREEAMFGIRGADVAERAVRVLHRLQLVMDGLDGRCSLLLLPVMAQTRSVVVQLTMLVSLLERFVPVPARAAELAKTTLSQIAATDRQLMLALARKTTAVRVEEIIASWISTMFVGTLRPGAVRFVWDQVFVTGKIVMLVEMAVILLILLRKRILAAGLNDIPNVLTEAPARLLTVVIVKSFRIRRSVSDPRESVMLLQSVVDGDDDAAVHRVAQLHAEADALLAQLAEPAPT